MRMFHFIKPKLVEDSTTLKATQTAFRRSVPIICKLSVVYLGIDYNSTTVGSAPVTVMDLPLAKTTSVLCIPRITFKPLYWIVTSHGNGLSPSSLTQVEDNISTPNILRNKPNGASPLRALRSPMPVPFSAW